MKPGMKLTLLIAGAVVCWTFILWMIFGCHESKPDAREIAKIGLYASVDNPESVKIVAVSKPDSVFGRNFVNDDEKMAIAMAMMKVNQKLMEETNDLEDIDFDNPRLSETMERQMAAVSVLRSLVTFDEPKAETKFSGWKVKIEYEAKTDGGSEYRSEYWAILDKDLKCVVNSFEIPLL